MQAAGGADGGSMGEGGSVDAGSSGSGGSAAGGAGGTSGTGAGPSVTCDSERQALVELLVANKSCTETADCRSHSVGCGVTEDGCTGAVFTNGDVNAAQIEPLRDALEACVTAHEDQVGCAVCERAALEPTCVEGLCLGTADCRLEAGLVTDFIGRNAACDVDADCVRESVGGQVTQTGCTGEVFLNGGFDQVAFGTLRDQFRACEDVAICRLPLHEPACNSGVCGPGDVEDPTPPEPEPVADCGERQAIVSSCSFEATCEGYRCGLPWSAFDERGCVRRTCTSSDACGADERCVPPPLLGDFACASAFSDSTPTCTREGNGACACETPEICDLVGYCLPSAFYPEAGDCNLGLLDCADLEQADEMLGVWLESLSAGDTRDALESCRSRISDSRGPCEGIAFTPECTRTHDGRLPLIELCGADGGVCLQSLTEYLDEIAAECGPDWPVIRTTKREGCGIVEVSDYGGTSGGSRFFDSVTGGLIGVSSGSDTPWGLCGTNLYEYGYTSPCEDAAECVLCAPDADPAALCP